MEKGTHVDGRPSKEEGSPSRCDRGANLAQADWTQQKQKLQDELSNATTEMMASQSDSSSLMTFVATSVAVPNDIMCQPGYLDLQRAVFAKVGPLKKESASIKDILVGVFDALCTILPPAWIFLAALALRWFNVLA